MFRKIVIGMLALAIVGSIAASGYEVGKYLAKREVANSASSAAKAATKG